MYWDADFCERLADQGFFVIRYDNRDVGKSTSYEPGTMPYGIMDLVEDAIRIVDEYQLKKAHIVGMSLGGLIAQIIALKYPDRVDALVLMSTGPWGTPDRDIPEMDPQIVDFHLRADQVDWDDEKKVVDYMLEGTALMVGKKPMDQAREKNRIRAEFRRAKHYRSMFNHALLQGGEAYYDHIDEIYHPTLIIHGTDDRIWHFKHTEKLLSEIRGAKLLTLEGTGHELNRYDWDQIIHAVGNFLG